MRKYLNVVGEVVTYVYIVLFLYTGISKFLELNVFREQLVAVFGPTLAIFISWIVPLLEIVLATALFFRRIRVISLKVSLLLMIAFTLYILFLMFFKDDLPCSCGGVIGSLSWSNHVLLNVGLIIFAALYLAYVKTVSMQEMTEKLK